MPLSIMCIIGMLDNVQSSTYRGSVDRMIKGMFPQEELSRSLRWDRYMMQGKTIRSQSE